MVGSIVGLSVREWILLLRGRRSSALKESPAVELPEYALAEGKPLHVLGVLGITLALAKELTTEGQTERNRDEAILCECGGPQPDGTVASGTAERNAHVRAYLESTERRYNGVTRCC
jgi:hypothetical protein